MKRPDWPGLLIVLLVWLLALLAYELCALDRWLRFGYGCG